MAIKKNTGRQYPLFAIIDFSYADLVAGTGLDALDLPTNAIVVGGGILVETAFNSATSATADVGEAGSATKYATGLDLKTTGYKALTGVYLANYLGNAIQLKFNEAGATATAGAGKLIVHYIVVNRANEAQTN